MSENTIEIPFEDVIESIIMFGHDNIICASILGLSVMKSYKGDIAKLRHDIINMYFTQSGEDGERTRSNFCKIWEEHCDILGEVFGNILWVKQDLKINVMNSCEED
jgi:hypothetical protein